MPATLAALLLPLMPVQEPDPPQIAMKYRADVIHFDVKGPKSTFAAAVILSLDSSLCSITPDLPPVLCNFVILSAGVTNGTYRTHIHEHKLPPGHFIYAQGVVADDHGIGATDVLEFILDASAPGDS